MCKKRVVYLKSEDAIKEYCSKHGRNSGWPCKHDTYWAIEIDGTYFVKFKTKPMGRWTKRLDLATPMHTELAQSYVDEWKRFGAKKIKVDN